jgi:hypothetical protein
MVAPSAVHNEFGWYVVRAEDRRTVPAPSLDEVRSTLREALMRKVAAQVNEESMKQSEMHEFNINGTQMGASQPYDLRLGPAPAQHKDGGKESDSGRVKD